MNIGDKIRIVRLTDEPYNSNYEGKEGTITKIETDPWGDMRYGGTWGSIYIYPHIDIIERVD
ncbi:MAG: hypothetical protein K5765_07020 [Clostridia bacterium]|nr:hypothetical protein [Clostridia bacterium]